MPSKLRTPAGIDHDYNFLHAIERSVERAEKLLVQDRAVVQEEELRPQTIQEVKWKPGRDGRKRKVLVTRILREAKGRTFERLLAQRLRKLNINIMCAPMGMSRMKENHTTLNRRSGRINWQVEWMTQEAQAEDVNDERSKKKRVLSKVMDDVPLWKAYHTLLEDQQRVKGQHTRRQTRPGQDGQSQDGSNSTWSAGSFALQDPFSKGWTTHQDTEPGMWPSEREEAQKGSFQFFLAKPHTRTDLATVLTKLQLEECLRDILANTRVLEFPTIYVFDKDKTLPEGYVLGPKDTVPPQGNAAGAKRKNPPLKKNSGKPSKKKRSAGKYVEEGEVRSDDEGGQSDEGDDTGGRGVALEVGDVVDEQSLGEEDDDEDDDTSSSGSDTEMD